MGILALGIAAVERGLVPDRLTRSAIRRLCGQRLAEGRLRAEARGLDVGWLRSGLIAAATKQANEQHNELARGCRPVDARSMDRSLDPVIVR